MSKVDKYTKLYTKYRSVIELIDRLIVLKSEIKVHKESLLLLKRIQKYMDTKCQKYMDTKCYAEKNFTTDVFVNSESVEMSVHKAAKHLYNTERDLYNKVLKEILKIKKELKISLGINPKKLQVRKLRNIRKSFLNKKIDYSELVDKSKKHANLALTNKESKLVTKQLQMIVDDKSDVKNDKSKVHNLLYRELGILSTNINEYNSLTHRIRAIKKKL